MPFEKELTECGFFDVQDGPMAASLEGIFAAVHRDWETIVQFWPSDRRDAYWVAGLVTRKATLDYRGTPIGLEGIRAALVKFFETTSVEWWWRRDRAERFASHPWITFPGDPEGIGTPGIRQFLSTYPYVRETAEGLYVQADVRKNPEGIKQFEKAQSGLGGLSGIGQQLSQDSSSLTNGAGTISQYFADNFRNARYQELVQAAINPPNNYTPPANARPKPEAISPYENGPRKIRIPE
jgi:hypothetical protein